MAEILIARLVILIGIFWGLRWIWKLVTHNTEPSPRNLLKEAAETVAKFNGRITPIELAFEMDIGLTEAQDLLETLVTEGLADVKVEEEDGRMTYDIHKLYGTPKRDPILPNQIETYRYDRAKYEKDKTRDLG